MKFKSKLLLGLSSVFFLFLLFDNQASAQSYSCQYAAGDEGLICKVQDDNCGPNLEENCAQFNDNLSACTGSHEDCKLVEFEPPEEVEPGTCPIGRCSEQHDCLSYNCIGADSSIPCSGTCACPSGTCNETDDCNYAGELVGCANVIPGEFCSGQCIGGVVDAPDPGITAPTCTRKDGNTGTPTAFGCLTFNLPIFIAEAVVASLGIGGGIALLRLIYAAYKYMTSSGNPDRLAEAKEIVVAALAGLLAIVLSAFILRVIGVDIFGLF